MKLRAALIVTSCMAVVGCSSSENKTAAPSIAPGARPAAAPAPAPKPFVYPAPVKGHYKEINTGDFDLVDGIAYPAADGKGTVVFVTEKPVASPVLATSSCPMTLTRAVALIRDSAYAEITIDATGRSKFFSAGTHYKGQGRSEDVGSHPWTISGGKVADGRITGSVVYRGYGSFDFDLPMSKPATNEVSESDRMDGRRFDKTRRAPMEPELVKAYTAMRQAALARDLKAMLELQGFDARQVEAIRGLPGIDADLAAHADRFLDPGTPDEPSVEPGHGGLFGRGKNSQGNAFANYYEFVPCGDKLVLTNIGLNPQ